MEVQGYEYYQERVKDVKLEDITSDDDNAEILAMVRDNNPEFTYFAIVTEAEYDWDFVAREDDDLGWLGYFVGRSKQIETLHIVDTPENINLSAFLRGLWHNRSIEKLQISVNIGESFQSLIPFLRNNDRLRDLNFNDFDIGLQCFRNIALLLSQTSSLKCLHFDETDIDDEGFSEIARALRSQPQIEELRLCCTYSVGRDGCLALGNTLENCLSLRKLNLIIFDHDDDDIGDEGLNALVAGLRNCHKLTSLNLNGNHMFTEDGSRSLSTLFQSDNCRLEHLHLDEMNIENDQVTVLATGLASVPSLKRLELWGMSISDRGLQDLARGLVNCNLEELDLSENMLMESVSGLRSLGILVRRSTNMHALSLSNSSLTDAGLQSLVEGMANSCGLTKLRISWNHLITANGLTSLSSLLRTEHCSLSDLDLYRTHLGDDGAAVLANGLIGNKSLTTLRVDNSSITARSWAAFSKLLCDKSSVNNTYLSNHTIFRIGDGMEAIPQDILQYLKLNKLQNRAAAICKILHSHPDIDVLPLFEFNLKCLPLVVAWLEKAKPCLCHQVTYESPEYFQGRKLSAVYKFVRGMPQLAVDGYHREKTKAKKKRKFDRTT